MSTIALLLDLVTTWAAFRVLAGRATLSTATFARVLAIGALCTTVLAIAVEQLAYTTFELQSITRLWAGPIDELAKALPLLAVIGCFATWRRFTISDYVLIGLAGALGYTVFDWVLAELSNVAPHVWQPLLVGSLHTESEWEHDPAYFTGAITTAFVGLIAGIGACFARRRWGVVLVSALALIFVAFENSIYRWLVGPVSAGWPPHLQPTPSVIGTLYGLFLHGRIELWLLVAGLPLANWLEGRWVRYSALPDQDRFLLDDDATDAVVAVEWIVAAQQLRHGWATFTRISRYFRDRRAFALLRAQARAFPWEPDFATGAEELEHSLTAQRLSIRHLDPAAIEPSFGAAAKWIGGCVAGQPLAPLVPVLFVLYFLVPPNAWQSFKPVLYSDWTALVLIATAFALLMHAGLRLRAAPVSTSDLFARDLTRLLTGAAAVTIVIAAGAWFVPFERLVPHYGLPSMNALEPFESWSAGAGWPLYGGNPHVLLAIVALLLACTAAIRPSQLAVAASEAASVTPAFASAQAVEGA